MNFYDNISLNLQPHCDIISFSRKTHHHTLTDEITIIIEIKDEYYILQDEYDKVFDVSKMPNYIKDDWINYNKKELSDKILIQHIKEYEDRYNWQYPPSEQLKETLDKLKTIKRNQTIQKIL